MHMRPFMPISTFTSRIYIHQLSVTHFLIKVKYSLQVHKKQAQ